jgi:hypothetical protein
MAIRATSSTGNFEADWGDGITTSAPGNITLEHQYDYSTLDVIPDSRGYKQVWIRLKSVNPAGTITSIIFNIRPSWRPSASASNIFTPQVLEIYIQCPNLSTLTFGSSPVYNKYSICEIFSLTENSLSSIAGLCSYMTSLQKIENLVINDGTVLTYFLLYCFSYNQEFPSTANLNGVTSSFMQSCFSYNQPFPSGVTFANATTSFMNACYTYNKPFPSGVTFASATSSFMSSCQIYNQQFPSGVTFANVTTSFMSSCLGYNQPFPSGVTFANATTSFMQNCQSYGQNITLQSIASLANIGTSSFNSMYSLKSLRLPNWNLNTPAITISGSSLAVDALVALFNDAPDRTATTQGTITITGCYGASTLSVAQRAIITDKNYSLVG